MGHRCVGESWRIKAEAWRGPSPGGQGEQRAREPEDAVPASQEGTAARAGGQSTGAGRQRSPGLPRQQGGWKPGRALDEAIRKSQATCKSTAGKARGALGAPAVGEEGRGGAESGRGENQCGPERRETKPWVKRPLFNDRGDPSISVVRREMGRAGESEGVGG